MSALGQLSSDEITVVWRRVRFSAKIAAGGVVLGLGLWHLALWGMVLADPRSLDELAPALRLFETLLILLIAGIGAAASFLAGFLTPGPNPSQDGCRSSSLEPALVFAEWIRSSLVLIGMFSVILLSHTALFGLDGVLVSLTVCIILSFVLIGIMSRPYLGTLTQKKSNLCIFIAYGLALIYMLSIGLPILWKYDEYGI